MAGSKILKLTVWAYFVNYVSYHGKQFIPGKLHIMAVFFFVHRFALKNKTEYINVNGKQI